MGFQLVKEQVVVRSSVRQMGGVCGMKGCGEGMQLRNEGGIGREGGLQSKSVAVSRLWPLIARSTSHCPGTGRPCKSQTRGASLDYPWEGLEMIHFLAGDILKLNINHTTFFRCLLKVTSY